MIRIAIDMLPSLTDGRPVGREVEVNLEDGVPDLLLLWPTVVNKDLHGCAMVSSPGTDPAVAVIRSCKNPLPIMEFVTPLVDREGPREAMQLQARVATSR